MAARAGCLRCGGPVVGDHHAAARRICRECARTLPGAPETRPSPAAPGGPGADPFRTPPPGTDLGGIVVEGHLGRGGMGTLLVCREAALDRRVAVKFLREDLASDSGHARRFLREGQSLARITHPHVVRVFRIGEWEGRPFLVMEFVEGKPLNLCIPPGGMAPAEALRIAVQLADALSAVHARDLVHRDVNPSNCVLRDSDRSLCLIDFGIARRLDRTTGSTGHIAGTPWYMAPEQVAGEEVDGRADVFAFGVTLFELLTGSLPFGDLDGFAYLQAVRSRTPPLLCAVRPGSPRELESFLARCLARDREFRPSGGEELLERLRDLRAGRARPAGGASGPPRPDPVPPAEPGEPPLLGRDGAFAAGREALEGALSCRGAVLLVEGTTGSGKSRILREIARAARARGMEVLACPGGEFPAAPRVALRAMLRGWGASAGAGDAGSLAALAAEASPADAPLLPALRWFLEGEPAGHPSPPGRTTLRRAVLALLRAAASRRPLLLAADDLHHLDEGSLELLSAAAEECGSWPMVLAASFLPREETPRRALDARVARLRALPHARTVDLPPLDEGSVAELARRILEIPAEEALRLAPSLLRRSAGNPLYAVESLRAMRHEGAPPAAAEGRRTRGRATSAVLPPTMADLAARRLSELDPGERDALGVASIDGRGVSSSLVARCLGTDRMGALVLLQHLARDRGLLVEAGSGYRIAHGGIRQAVYDGLLRESRARFHGAAAEELLAEGGAAADPERLGMHLLHAGRAGEAAPLLLETAQRLADGGSDGDALELLDRLAKDGAAPAPRAARLLRADVLDRVGEVAEARREYESLAADPDCDAEALLEYATFLWNREDPDGVMGVVARLEGMALTDEQAVRRAVERSKVLSRTGRAAEALALVEEVAALAGRCPPRQRLRWRLTLGSMLWRCRKFADARDAWTAALEEAEANGDQDTAAVLLHDLAMVSEDLGDPVAALAWAEKAVEKAAVFGSERAEVHARLQLADRMVQSLRLDEALPLLSAVEPHLDRLESAMARVLFLSRHCEIALARGDGDEALRRAEALGSCAPAWGGMAAAADLYRGQALALAGRREEALAAARRAAAASAASGDGDGGEEALALASRMLRELGLAGPEREGVRGLLDPATAAGAAEAAREASDPVRRGGGPPAGGGRPPGPRGRGGGGGGGGGGGAARGGERRGRRWGRGRPRTRRGAGRAAGGRSASPGHPGSGAWSSGGAASEILPFRRRGDATAGRGGASPAAPSCPWRVRRRDPRDCGASPWGLAGPWIRASPASAASPSPPRGRPGCGGGDHRGPA